MFGLPRNATILWVAVVAAAVLGASVAAAAAIGDPRLASAALLFAIAAGIAESFQVPFPTSRPGNRVTFSVSAAIITAAILIFPVHWAVLIATLGVVAGSRTVWYKRVFNSAQMQLSALLAGLVWQVGGHGLTLTDAGHAAWVPLTCVVYFVANTGLVAAIVSRSTNMPLQLTWVRMHRHTWAPMLGVVFVGVLVAIVWSTSAWMIGLAAIPLTALYYALRNTVSLETNTIEALFQLADILDARDAYTHGHSLRVGQYAEQLALEMGVSGDEAHMIFLAGRLHDIGKCAVRNEVLLKPGALDPDEREHMCIHPAVGGSMLASFSLFKECAGYVRGHHERWDGKGYPDGLSGEAIPLGARVIAVADSFDAMTTTRPYRKALPLAEAQRRLAEGAGTQWDPRVVEVFLRILETTQLGQPTPDVLPLPVERSARAA
jgi:HD-GYP domain-containing protein (c-di-GMP phosphodiesterase class II)